jgi:hypothetical protein
MKTIFLIYKGSLSDGRGEPKLVKATLDKKQAMAYYVNFMEKPYLTGRVEIITRNGEKKITADPDTNWGVL